MPSRGANSLRPIIYHKTGKQFPVSFFARIPPRRCATATEVGQASSRSLKFGHFWMVFVGHFVGYFVEAGQQGCLLMKHFKPQLTWIFASSKD